jgi:integrase
MAWIESRRELHRVYWYNRPGVQPGRDYEAFASRPDAELFIQLISAMGGDPVAARAYVRRDAAGPVAAEAVTSGGLRLDMLRDAYLDTKTAVYDETRGTYIQLIDDHIISYFGAGFDVTHMSAVPSLLASKNRGRTSVSGWLAWMQKRHARTSHGRELPHFISAKTIRNVHGVLAEMMEMVVDDPDIGMDRNPCAKSKLPKASTQEMHFLEKAQFAQLLQLFGEFYRPLLLTLVMTGIRWGEAAGLQMKNLHLDADIPYLYVCKALRRPKGKKPVLSRPKTESSVRQIPLNPKLVELLRRHTAGMGPNDFVFRMRGGGPLHNGNFHAREWNPALAKAIGRGILTGDGLRIHDLRHTHAAWLISAGRPLLTVKNRLGHASIVTTNRYSHLTADVNPADMEVLDDAFPLLAHLPADIEAESGDVMSGMDAEERALPEFDLSDNDDLAA